MIPLSLLPCTLRELVSLRAVLHKYIRSLSRAWINSGTSQLVFTPLFQMLFKAFVIQSCLILLLIICVIERVVSLIINRLSKGTCTVVLSLS